MLSHCLRRLSTSHPGTAACCSAVVQLLSRSCLNPALPDPCTAQSRALNVLQYNDRAAVVARSLGLAQPAALQQTCQHVTTAAVPGWASRSYATRLGFGIKVALPARDVLRQEVVSGADGPVEVTLRAYHVGSRIHIGRMLQRVQALFPECQTTAGKDYAITWLDPILEHGPQQDWQDRLARNSKLMSVNAIIAALTLKRAALSSYLSAAQRSGPLQLMGLVEEGSKQDASSSGDRGSSGSTSGASHSSSSGNSSSTSTSSSGQHDPGIPSKQHHKRDRLREVVTMPYYPGRPTAGRNFRPLPPGFLGSAPGLSQQQQQQQQQQRPRPLQLPFMAVYRSGSVVFGGLDEKEELWWLSQLVPPLVRYTGKDGSPWTKGRQVLSVSSKESHVVVVDAACPSDAQQGSDQVRLRVLDVGAVRVLTSVLAQSAALRFYEESVQKALELLADWRVANRTSHVDRSSRAFRFLVTRKQEKVLFKVIAASALIITEARQLLEVAEPAWQYDTYNKIWEVMAQDYQLESRITSLGVKLEQVEREAKFDVQARAGRRQGMLNQSIVWLLVVSCLVAAMEVVVNESKAVKTAAPDHDKGDIMTGGGAGGGFSTAGSTM